MTYHPGPCRLVQCEPGRCRVRGALVFGRPQVDARGHERPTYARCVAL